MHHIFWALVTSFWAKRQSRCCCETVFQIWLTFKSVGLFFFSFFVVLGRVHCGIYTGSYTASNILHLNFPSSSFSFIALNQWTLNKACYHGPYPISWKYEVLRNYNKMYMLERERMLKAAKTKCHRLGSRPTFSCFWGWKSKIKVLKVWILMRPLSFTWRKQFHPVYIASFLWEERKLLLLSLLFKRR
jgi:hypothetical protein